jgi:hypothetical protein
VVLSAGSLSLRGVRRDEEVMGRSPEEYLLMTRLPQRLNSLPKNSVLILLLGSAAVHRCDNRLVCSAGFTGGGKTHGGTAAVGCPASEAR